MALTNEGMARGPVKTYEDLRATIADSGRAYDEEKIQRAYALAERAHKGQLRLSGESYISHPLAVACLVVDLGLDTDSVVAALLHDSVEDTDTTLDDVKAQFGADVALLVDGVTKLGRIKFSSVEEQQAEAVRQAAQHAHGRFLARAEAARQGAGDDGGVRPHCAPFGHGQCEGRAGGPQPAVSGPRGL